MCSIEGNNGDWKVLGAIQGVSIEVVLIGLVLVIRSGLRTYWHYLNVPTADVLLLPIRKTFEQYLEKLP
jgi:hypothetical protein